MPPHHSLQRDFIQDDMIQASLIYPSSQLLLSSQGPAELKETLSRIWGVDLPVFRGENGERNEICRFVLNFLPISNKMTIFL